MSADMRPKPGDTVVLAKMPHRLLNGLPIKDQRAIRDVIGKPIRLNNYDDDGRAELQFTDQEGEVHFIYVNPNSIKAAKS
jgi:hypothetical protein